LLANQEWVPVAVYHSESRGRNDSNIPFGKDH